jgi:hypothetical protein
MFYLQPHFYQQIIYVCLIYISGFVSVVLAPFLSCQTTPVIDTLHFKDVNMVKLFKSFFGRWSHLRGAPLGEFAVKQ